MTGRTHLPVSRAAGAWNLAVLLAMLAMSTAVSAATVDTGAVLRDPEFGIESRALGLRRGVEMLQWSAGEGGDTLVWSDRPLVHARHANPGAWPMRGERWLAGAVRVDGHPVDDAVVAAFARWQPLSPSEDALPDAMAATFVPAGGYLTTAQDPDAPAPGDLRVRWEELVLPPLTGRAVESDGRWVLADPATVDAARAAVEGEAIPAWRLLMPFAGALLCAVLVLAWRRRRRD